MTVQEYGTFFAGFAWDVFGCGSYRSPVSAEAAERAFESFVRRLRTELRRAPVAYIAVLEHRYSGCGHYEVPRHWHFVFATHPMHREALLRSIRLIWQQSYGNQKSDFYDPQQYGAAYMAKLAGQTNFEFRFHLDKRVPYNGPKDIYDHLLTDPYVPDHVRGKRYAQTLRLHPGTAALRKRSEG